jgi:hypothetical protein
MGATSLTRVLQLAVARAADEDVIPRVTPNTVQMEIEISSERLENLLTVVAAVSDLTGARVTLDHFLDAMLNLLIESEVDLGGAGSRQAITDLVSQWLREEAVDRP